MAEASRPAGLRGRALVVLAYHKIGPPSTAPATPYHTPQHVFRGHLEALRQNEWSVVGIDDVLRALASPGSLPERAALLTFDDGYRSVLEYACPVLTDFGLPATVFVPTNFVGASSLFDGEAAEPICSIAELKELQASGVSVQSHGRSHVKLSTLTPSAVEDELRRSKVFLEDALGRSVNAFAFPYGDPGDPTVVAPALQRCGYGAAFLYGGAPFRLPAVDAYELPRIPMEPNTDLQDELKRTVRSDLRRHLERATAARWSSLAVGWDAAQLEALDSLLFQHVPPSSGVIWVEPAIQPPLTQRTLCAFPRPLARSWQIFASGTEGSRAAPWIAPEWAYEFRLRTAPFGAVVAAVTVVAEPPAFELPPAGSEQQAEPKSVEGPYLRAFPNPAPVQGTHGLTTLSWSTGDGPAGEVEMAAYAIRDEIPEDDAGAIAAVEQLRADGARFLLLPAMCLWWLDAYPELKQHLAESFRLLADLAGVGRLYDLSDSRNQRRRS